MNQYQLLCRLEHFNNQIGHSVEGLNALAHMIEVCDSDEAPMPLQLAELIRVVVGYAGSALSDSTVIIEELKVNNK
ncbi:hypothetical protein [Actinobacillus pleuropneumoniae]|uniref:hypothetical protein n=1 Tax=Actinobacillus pleuropneumoniae TaxID=715 RepID=UPI003B02083D